MDYRGHNHVHSHSQHPFNSFFTGPLLTNPNMGEFIHNRPARPLNLMQNHNIVTPNQYMNLNCAHEEQRPMTSTIRRFRVRREEDYHHNSQNMTRQGHMRRHATESENTQSPSSQMLESVFFSLMEQIQAGNEDEHKQELPVEMRDKVKRLKMGKSGQQCSVCYENFKKGCKIRKLPCKHIFHDQCIMPWLEKNSTCPNCRLDLFEFFTENPEGDY